MFIDFNFDADTNCPLHRSEPFGKRGAVRGKSVQPFPQATSHAPQAAYFTAPSMPRINKRWAARNTSSTGTIIISAPAAILKGS